MDIEILLSVLYEGDYSLLRSNLCDYIRQKGLEKDLVSWLYNDVLENTDSGEGESEWARIIAETKMWESKLSD